MATPGTPFKRLFVRDLLAKAKEEGTTVCVLLRAAAVARLSDSASGGKVMVGTSGNGHSATFEVPSDFSPSDATEMVSDIYDRWDEAHAALVAAGNASPTDALVGAELLDKLWPVRSSGSDFSGLRIGREELE